MDARKLKILQAIISDFISTAEPVGSRTLSKKYDLGVSAATIRNEMADLEDLGYLTHPHTSAGRVPSEKAYRFYVNEIMKKRELSKQEKEEIAIKLAKSMTELDKTIEHATQLLSEITNLISFALMPCQDHDKLKFIRLVPVDNYSVVLMIVADSGKVSHTTLRLSVGYTEEMLRILSATITHNFKGKRLSDTLKMDIIHSFESDIEAMSRLAENIMPNFIKTIEDMLDVGLHMDGIANIFSLPEYNDIYKARLFMEMIGRKEELTKTLVSRDDGLLITIGDENMDESMKDCSLITATYHVDGKLVGKLGVIGPTRMKYAEITSVIEFLTDNISETFRSRGGNNDKGEE